MTVALRIVDANYNRANEGLRVIEEYFRFGLGDQHLTKLAKQLRHDLTAVMRQIPSEQLHAARQTQTDVGTNLAFSQPLKHESPQTVTAANLKRVQQALRSIEEYTKVLHPLVAQQVQSLRYRSYTLEKAITATVKSRAELADRFFYVLLDGAGSVKEFEDRVDQLVSAGVHMLQLRDKTLDDRQLVERGRRLRQQTLRQGTLFIMNDRPDLAVLTEADGVHVGQEDLMVSDVRRIVGPHMLIGVSTHSLEQARQAVLDGANYLGVGPVFPSGTKRFESFPGLDLVRQVSREISLPAFAIGGITPDNLDEVVDAGIQRISVSHAVVGARDPFSAARQLLSRLTERTGPAPIPPANP